MVDYKKLYAFLVGTIDDNLTRLEKLTPVDIGELKKVRESMQAALLAAEDYVLDDGETPLFAKK